MLNKLQFDTVRIYYLTVTIAIFVKSSVTLSAFLGAKGVLVYEMVMASTPFAPKKADNVTELFTNIAMVTVRL